MKLTTRSIILVGMLIFLVGIVEGSDIGIVVGMVGFALVFSAIVFGNWMVIRAVEDLSKKRAYRICIAGFLLGCIGIVVGNWLPQLGGIVMGTGMAVAFVGFVLLAREIGRSGPHWK